MAINPNDKKQDETLSVFEWLMVLAFLGFLVFAGWLFGHWDYPYRECNTTYYLNPSSATSTIYLKDYYL